MNFNWIISYLGLANRGLGSLETAQDEKAEEAVKMQALTDGNHFYAGCKFVIPKLWFITFCLFSNWKSKRKGRQYFGHYN